MGFLVWSSFVEGGGLTACLGIAQSLIALARELLLTIAAALGVVVVWRQAHREE